MYVLGVNTAGLATVRI